MIALDRQAAVLKAIIGVLGADAALKTIVAQRIYDVAPARPTTPLVTLKSVGAIDASSSDSEAQRLTVDADVWDRYGFGTDLGRPRLVMAHVRRILHLQPLVVPGCSVVLLRCTAAQGPFRDPDGVTVHGIVTIQALAGYETAG